MSPSARPGIPPSCSCPAVVCHTVRKHSTWRHRPLAIAIAALRIDDAGPRHVGAAADPRRLEPQRLLERRDATLAEPDLVAAATGIVGDAVDVVGRQPGIGDRRQAGVDGQRQRVAHQPAAEVGTADARDHRPVLVPIVGERQPHGRPRRLDHPVDRIELAGRARTAGSTRRRIVFEHAPRPRRRSRRRRARTPTMFVVRWIDGSSASAHVGDGVRRREVGQPLLMVDREPDDGAAARHHPRRRRRLRHAGHTGDGGWTQRAAVVAALDAQLAVLARRPEPRAPRQQPGQRPRSSSAVVSTGR